MKSEFYRTLLILLLLIPSFAAICAAQTPTPEPTAQTEIMGEDDRLPFMQNQNARETDETSSGGLLLKTLGAMLLIVGLIFGGAWGARKLGFGNSAGKNASDEMNLSVLQSVSLGGGQTLSTVRFGGKILLVGSTAQAVTLLAEEENTAANSLLPTRSVAELLDEETFVFEKEFEKAQINLENGGQI